MTYEEDARIIRKYNDSEPDLWPDQRFGEPGEHREYRAVYKDPEAEGIRAQADVIARGMAAYACTLSGQTRRGRYVLKRLLVTVNKLRYQAWKIEKGIY